MDQLTSMRIFVDAAENQSLVAAARNLNLSPSAVSEHIAALESRLGAQLLVRTTRHVAITEVGAEYLRNCRHILTEPDKAGAHARDAAGAVQGSLRFDAPSGFAQHHIAPHLLLFMKQYPHVTIDLVTTDAPDSLIEAHLDFFNSYPAGY